MIAVTVNGKPRELRAPTGLTEFLDAAGLMGRRIAIGYNGEVIHRNHWREVTLGHGDVLDIVQMVGGG